MHHDKDELRDFAQENRKNMPKGEVRLWMELRRRQLGHKFRRQHVLGPFIVDFICLEKRLIVEVDGSQHSVKGDRSRQEYLERLGFRVIRFWSLDVLEYTPQVVKEVKAALEGVELTGRGVEWGGELIEREHEHQWPE